MVFVFGEYELDTERIELRQAGQPLAVEPQVFDVLVYLAANRSRVVSKNELLDNVWGDRFVSESALTSRIKAARRLCGDDGRSQHVIRTSHGRGYRFVASVIEREPGVNEGATGNTRPAAVAMTSSESSASARVAVAEPVAALTSAVGGSSSAVGWPLVGRGVELDLIARCFSDRGVGGVVLTGVAGLGKTRLAEESLAAAAASGVATARVTGYPEASGVSLGALAHLVPSDAVSVGPEGELDRSTLFHHARAAITALAPAGERLMLLVDDIDQLDELSRALIGSLVVDRSVFALITLRSGQEPVRTVEHLEKEGHLQTLRLSELESDVVETLLHRVLGGPMLAEALDRLVAASLGNPGVLRQLVETARRSGVLVDAHGIWFLDGALQADTSLEALVAAGLRDLDGDALRAVELLSVAGEIGLDVLTDLVGSTAIDVIDRQGAASLRVSGHRHDLTLAHPLFGEVVLSNLSPLRARLLRRQLADAIEAVGARRRDDEVRIVAWRLDGGGDIEPTALLRAARLALLDGNLTVALRLLEPAHAANPTAEVVQLLAEVQFRRGNTPVVEELLAGIDLAPLDDHRRAVIARRRANNRFFGTTDYQGSFDILTDAIEAATDPEALRSLRATLAQLAVNGGQVAVAIEHAAATLPGATGAVRLEALRALALAHIAAGQPVDALTAVHGARALHAAVDTDVELPGLTMVLFSEALALAEQGRIDEARAAVAAARRDHPHGQMTWLDTALGRVELLAGRPRATRRAVTPVVHATRARSQGAAERWVLSLHACGWLLEGDVDKARPEIARAVELEDGPRGLFHPDIDRAKAWLAAYCDDLEGAVEQLMWSADDSRDRGAHGFELRLLHDVARFGAADSVIERVGALAAIQQGALVEACVDHVAGLASHDADQLILSADGFEACGATLFAAEAASAAARTLTDLGRTTEADLIRERSSALATVGGVRLVSPALVR